MSKIKGYFIVGAICFFVGSAATFTIVKRLDTITINRISNELADSKATGSRIADENKRITRENSELTEINRQSQATIGRLEKHIADDDKRTQETVGRIGTAIDDAARGLSEAGSGLKDSESAIGIVIEGLSKIAELIKVLP